MTISAGTRLGPYEILAPLGAGGMGEVYRARDPKLKRDVAIKVLPEALSRDAEALSRFEREALAVAALSHPGILSIFDFGTHDGVAYAVMELLEGGTLRERLQAGPIPTAKAVALGREIAEGLAAAHAKGIVHRDLKPENLFVTRDGRLKILDFGLARRTDGERDDRTSAPTLARTEPGTVMGTVGYMSPEQVRGIPVDHRSDIFSLGAVLYELLCGRRAFKKGTAAETMTAILNEEPDELSADGWDVPPGLARITRRCLEKDPDERFQSARDVSFALEAASDPSTTSRTKAPAPIAPPPRRARRTIGVAGAIAAAAALAGALLSHALWKPSAPSQPRFRQLTFKRGSILNARFGPDGKTVVYSAAWDGNPTEIFTTAASSLESRPVGIRNASLLSIARTGELAVSLGKGYLRSFIGRGTLARVALDGGAPREVLEDVLNADFTPDGKDLAVLRQEGVDFSIEMPIGKRIFGPSAEIHPLGDLRVSPDGSSVATFENGPAGLALVTIDAAGKKVTRSRSYPGIAGIAWDRTGKAIWFGTVVDGERSIQIADLSGRERTVLKLPGAVVHDLSPDGHLLIEISHARRDLQVLVPGEESERTLSWLGGSTAVDISADGRLVLFVEHGSATLSRLLIFVRGTDGSPAVRLGEGVPFALSPDARFVLAMVGTPQRLTLVPTGAGETKGLDQGPIETIRSATFHPDGKSVLISGAEKGRKGRIWRVGMTGPPLPISVEGVAFQGRAVSPDGKWVVAFRDLGNFFLHSLEGQLERATAGDTGNTHFRGWSEDGKWLYVVPGGGAPGRIDRFDPVSGHRERLRDRIPPDVTTVTSTSGDAITPDGRGHVYGCGWTTSSDLWVIEGLK